MQEQYTLEEWMGMLEEAGYSLEEGNAENKAKKKEYIMRIGRAHGNNDRGIDTPSKAAGQTDSEATHSGRKEVRTTDRAISNLEAGARLERAIRKLKNNPHFTLDEWMSKLEEAGYDVSEYSLWRPKESNAKSSGVVKEPKKEKGAPKEPKPKKSVNELSPETLASYNAKATKDLETHDNIMKRDSSNFERKARNRHKGIQAARGVLRAQGMPTEPKVEESTISESTVARLQGLAGIKPLNG